MFLDCYTTVVTAGSLHKIPGNSLLKGPGLIHQKIPLDGRTVCMALPKAKERTSNSNDETDKFWGLK